MIVGRHYDKLYHPWFAWRPVKLSGPDEWERERRLNVGPRFVWLRWVWRYKCKPNPYYALPDENTTNALLRQSIRLAA